MHVNMLNCHDPFHGELIMFIMQQMCTQKDQSKIQILFQLLFCAKTFQHVQQNSKRWTVIEFY